MADCVFRGLTVNCVAVGGLAALCLTGCYSNHSYSWEPFSPNGPGWSSYEGQAIWKPTPSVPELTGDVFLSVNTNGSAFVQFAKTVPILTAQIQSNIWEVQISSPGRTYSGELPLPNRFGWLQLPGVALSQAPPSPWTLTGDISTFEIHNPETGEDLRGYFNSP